MLNRIRYLTSIANELNKQLLNLHTHLTILEEEMTSHLTPTPPPSEIVTQVIPIEVPDFSPRPILFSGKQHFKRNISNEESTILSYVFDEDGVYYFNKKILDEFEVQDEFGSPYVFGKILDSDGNRIQGELEFFVERKKEDDEDDEGEEDVEKKGFILLKCSSMAFSLSTARKKDGRMKFPGRESLFARKGDILTVSLISEQTIEPDNCRITFESLIFEESYARCSICFENIPNSKFDEHYKGCEEEKNRIDDECSKLCPDCNNRFIHSEFDKHYKYGCKKELTSELEAASEEIKSLNGDVRKYIEDYVPELKGE